MSTMDPQDPNAAGFPPPPGYGTPPPGYGAPSGPPTGMPPFADWGTRVGAALLDGVVAAAIVIPFGIIGAGVGGGAGVALLVLGYLGALAWLVMQTVKQGQTGQTFGKAKLGIRLLRLRDGQPVGVGMSFLRLIVHQIDSAVCMLGYLWPLWDEKKQTWTDKVLDTVVVKT